ncbi:MAG: alkaline phosphatase family protein, partial [Bdellovibrionales bacterium]|nr:alkaline phosphatase family protein [Bdellovibrionales bacterium]
MNRRFFPIRKNYSKGNRNRERKGKGLILIQIDGLSFEHYKQASDHNKLPFLTKLSQKFGYEVVPMYSGLPSTTPAVQAELFYGIKGAVPAFSFVDSNTNRLGKMYDPEFASLIQKRLEQNSDNLLNDGGAYSNIYSGGAKHSQFCPGSFNWNQSVPNLGWLRSLLLCLKYPLNLCRIVSLLLIESVLSISDVIRGILERKDFAKELKFIPSRVMICILLRELTTYFAIRDINRQLPIIHLNYLGYDEQAHRRGPSSRFAYWSLKGIDKSISKLWRVTQKTTSRDYSIWIYSDHGQEEVDSYFSIHGRSVEEAITEVLGEEIIVDP